MIAQNTKPDLAVESGSNKFSKPSIVQSGMHEGDLPQVEVTCCIVPWRS